ncbi:hypothetical protein ABC347_08230 [Sphingomonas sp. 1P06PA]|uniref:hypothetical protein n=1 Tax=Sphingomonas sp. 1P06PA TaxID=554121 RepID=UPI0039A42269
MRMTRLLRLNDNRVVGACETWNERISMRSRSIFSLASPAGLDAALGRARRAADDVDPPHPNGSWSAARAFIVAGVLATAIWGALLFALI